MSSPRPAPPRSFLHTLLLAGVAVPSLHCAPARGPVAASNPAPTVLASDAAWSLIVLGGECTLSGQGAQATVGACAGLGTFDLRQDPASARLGALVAALAPMAAAPPVDGWPSAQLAVVGAPVAAVSDGWIPIARELKRVLRARPASVTALAPPPPPAFFRWHLTAADGRCQVAGHGAQVLTVDCPGLPSAVSADLRPLTTWLAAAAIDPGGMGAAPCTVATELADPYPLAAGQCAELASIIEELRVAGARPRDPMNKLDARATLALAQLDVADDPAVDVLLEWSAAPADRDRIIALGGVFGSTTLTSIQGLRIPLRALPAVAALASVTRIELGQPLVADHAR